MDIQLKQRLVGAIVLVSLGVIFIPMILPGNNSDSLDMAGSNIPPEPDYGFTPPPKAPPAPVVEKAAPVIEKAAEPATSSKTTAAAKPKGKSLDQSMDSLVRKAIPQHPAEPEKGDSPKTSTSASAWVVQVGSFSSRANALALRDKIRQQGHASFVEAVKGGNGMVYRVRVGPELSRELANQLQATLQSQLKLKGMVLKYP